MNATEYLFRESFQRVAEREGQAGSLKHKDNMANEIMDNKHGASDGDADTDTGYLTAKQEITVSKSVDKHSAIENSQPVDFAEPS